MSQEFSPSCWRKHGGQELELLPMRQRDMHAGRYSGHFLLLIPSGSSAQGMVLSRVRAGFLYQLT